MSEFKERNSSTASAITALATQVMPQLAGLLERDNAYAMLAVSDFKPFVRIPEEAAAVYDLDGNLVQLAEGQSIADKLVEALLGQVQRDAGIIVRALAPLLGRMQHLTYYESYMKVQIIGASDRLFPPPGDKATIDAVVAHWNARFEPLETFFKDLNEQCASFLEGNFPGAIERLMLLHVDGRYSGLLTDEFHKALDQFRDGKIYESLTYAVTYITSIADSIKQTTGWLNGGGPHAAGFSAVTGAPAAQSGSGGVEEKGMQLQAVLVPLQEKIRGLLYEGVLYALQADEYLNTIEKAPSSRPALVQMIEGLLDTPKSKKSFAESLRNPEFEDRLDDFARNVELYRTHGKALIAALTQRIDDGKFKGMVDGLASAPDFVFDRPNYGDQQGKAYWIRYLSHLYSDHLKTFYLWLERDESRNALHRRHLSGSSLYSIGEGIGDRISAGAKDKVKAVLRPVGEAAGELAASSGTLLSNVGSFFDEIGEQVEKLLDELKEGRYTPAQLEFNKLVVKVATAAQVEALETLEQPLQERMIDEGRASLTRSEGIAKKEGGLSIIYFKLAGFERNIVAPGVATDEKGEPLRDGEGKIVYVGDVRYEATNEQVPEGEYGYVVFQRDGKLKIAVFNELGYYIRRSNGEVLEGVLNSRSELREFLPNQARYIEGSTDVQGIRHSSANSGAPVLGAGVVQISAGHSFDDFNNSTGHYLTEFSDVARSVKHAAEQGFAVTAATVTTVGGAVDPHKPISSDTKDARLIAELNEQMAAIGAEEFSSGQHSFPGSQVLAVGPDLKQNLVQRRAIDDLEAKGEERREELDRDAEGRANWLAMTQKDRDLCASLAEVRAQLDVEELGSWREYSEEEAELLKLDPAELQTLVDTTRWAVANGRITSGAGAERDLSGWFQGYQIDLLDLAGSNQ